MDKSDVELLQELKKKLLSKIRSTKTTPRDLPALTRELRNVMTAIGELEAGDEETEAQRIRREREERRSARQQSSDGLSNPNVQ